jgi:putative ABC transport system ATP-binding protein
MKGYSEKADLLSFLVVSLVFNVIELLLCIVWLPKRLRSAQRAVALSLAINEEASATEGEGKKKGGKDELWRLLKMSRPEAGILFWGLVNLVISSLSFVAGPYLFGEIINAATDDDQSELTRYVWILVVIYGIGSIASFFRGWLFTLAGQFHGLLPL